MNIQTNVPYIYTHIQYILGLLHNGIITSTGSDLARSILVFAKAKPLGPEGYDWLKIHLVNLTGLRKRLTSCSIGGSTSCGSRSIGGSTSSGI